MKSSTAWNRSPRICECCNSNYEPVTKWQKTCSQKCGITFQNNKKKRSQTNFGSCLRCQKSLHNKKSHAIYCSKTCKSMDHTFKHRSKTRVSKTARRAEIYMRDNESCYMCDKKLSLAEVEIDHLLPVSRNGENGSENLATSCKRCNRSRGSRIGILQLRKMFELRQ